VLRRLLPVRRGLLLSDNKCETRIRWVHTRLINVGRHYSAEHGSFTVACERPQAQGGGVIVLSRQGFGGEDWKACEQRGRGRGRAGG
jgi:hypothetical protein